MDWATERGHSDECAAHLAPTVDHKLIVTAVGSRDWLELPGDRTEQAISSAERRLIAGWLKEQF